MTKQDLVKMVKRYRDQLLYTICYDEKDFNSLKRYVEKIIFDLETAFLANPGIYVNLEMHVDAIKNDLEQERKEIEDRHLCRQVRQRVLSVLRKIVTDNSPPSKSQNKNSISRSS